MKIMTFGGYSKIGKNMTVTEVDGEFVINDMGADIERLVDYEDENSSISTNDTNTLMDNGIIPDDRNFFAKYADKVKAIVLTHGHLDHVWAVPFLANKYHCPVIATPFTIKIIEKLLHNFKERNPKLIRLNGGSTYNISDKINLEFVHITHSIPQTVLSVLHTRYGAAVYANDWKFDNEPTLGRKPDYKRMEEISKKGIHSVISDSTNVDVDGYTFSESVVRTMLQDVMTKSMTNKTVFITTFSSHIARIKNIIDISRRLGREVLVFGRSMDMYLRSAIDCKIVGKNMPHILTKGVQINHALRMVKDRPGKYVVICTGHQGEKGAFLDKLATGRFDYRLSSDDGVIFSSRTIPTKINMANRSMLQKALEEYGVNIADEVHASGHASKNDHRMFLKMLKPEHYIPSHGGIDKISAGIELGKELGYELNKTSHILLDNQELNL